MARCNCPNPCPRCANGPCDCTCTEEQVTTYTAETEARIANWRVWRGKIDELADKGRKDMEGLSLFGRPVSDNDLNEVLAALHVFARHIRVLEMDRPEEHRMLKARP